MGGVSDFLFGKPSKQTSSNSSSSSSTSDNQSYGILSQALAPTLGYGAQAGNMMGALLGLPSSSPSAPAPSPSYNPSTPVYNPTPSYGGSPYGYQSGGGSDYQTYNDGKKFQLDSGVDFQNDYGKTGVKTVNYGKQPYGAPAEVSQYQPQSQPYQSPQSPQISGQQAGSALENFSNSAGMDFLRNQGVKAIEASQAGKGMLQSGATGQALTSFGNNLSKTYLNDYLSHLNDYASLGTKNAAVLSGAGASSSSTGSSSGTGNANGGKAGLVNTLLGNPGLGTAVAAFA